MSTKRPVVLVLSVIGGLILLIALFSTVTIVDAGNIVVKQDVLDGNLTVWTEPGPKAQLFGDMETYKKSDKFSFEAHAVEGKSHDNNEPNEGSNLSLDDCFRIRFNDNGTAAVCGSVNYRLPKDEKSMRALHTEFRSFAAIRERVVRPSIDKAVYNSGPLMSSRESAGDRRAELLNFISDQAKRGVYHVKVTEEEVEDFFADPIVEVQMVAVPKLDDEGHPVVENGKPVMEKVAKKVKKQPTTRRKIVEPRTENGKILIAEPSTASQFGVELYNFTINKIFYDTRVMEQIKAQQKAMMSIQTARAEAQKADQDAKTVEAQGRASVARAKAKQDVEKQTKVTQAEARLAVAEQDLETARKKAEAKRVEADAEAYAKQKVMTADGALDKKLEAYVKTQKAWADAAAKQRLVPEVQMGASNSGAASGLQGMMEVMSAKAARDLALDLDVKSRKN